MKAGFVNIFGKPNAGKSTLLNALMGEKLAIVSHKVQTTRHRIKGFVTQPGAYQIIFSDTPGIIEPKYKLHEKMMQSVKSALEDADLALLLVDPKDNYEESAAIFKQLRLKVPALLLINKVDVTAKALVQEVRTYFEKMPYVSEVLEISAQNQLGIAHLLTAIVDRIPKGDAFYSEDDLTDLPTKFFVGEIIREKIFELYGDEIPYHAAVMVNEYKEKDTLIKIQADVVVQRETQKMILLGEKGSGIKKLGTLARTDIEAFVGRKVFLELFIKVRPKWRENELQLREYGY